MRFPAHRRAVFLVSGSRGFHHGALRVHVHLHGGVWVEKIRFNLEPARVKGHDFFLGALAAHVHLFESSVGIFGVDGIVNYA